MIIPTDHQCIECGEKTFGFFNICDDCRETYLELEEAKSKNKIKDDKFKHLDVSIRDKISTQPFF